MMPHGWCLLWSPTLITAHVVSDLAIAVAYFMIPAFLLSFRHLLVDRRRRMLTLLFTMFILSCGVTHVMEVIVLWHPVYWIQAGVKVICAGLSLATLGFLIHLLNSAPVGQIDRVEVA